jgi:hypothetical protein
LLALERARTQARGERNRETAEERGKRNGEYRDFGAQRAKTDGKRAFVRVFACIRAKCTDVEIENRGNKSIVVCDSVEHAFLGSFARIKSARNVGLMPITSV